MPKREVEEADPLQVAALFCVIVGAAMLATTYSGSFDLFKGLISGIVLLAAGATLFAYDKAPKQTVQSLSKFLNFLRAIVNGLFEIIKTHL